MEGILEFVPKKPKALDFKFEGLWLNGGDGGI